MAPSFPLATVTYSSVERVWCLLSGDCSAILQAVLNDPLKAPQIGILKGCRCTWKACASDLRLQSFGNLTSTCAAKSWLGLPPSKGPAQATTAFTQRGAFRRQSEIGTCLWLQVLFKTCWRLKWPAQRCNSRSLRRPRTPRRLQHRLLGGSAAAGRA